MLSVILLAATLLNFAQNGIELKVDSETETIDPARSVFVTVTLKSPRGVKAIAPDLRDRVRGFSLAEDFEDPNETLPDGSTVMRTNWKLIPEPCAKEYKIAPFAVHASPVMLSTQSDDGKLSFIAGPIRFHNPPACEPVTGAMECDPKKDLPPLSWALVGKCAAALLGLAAIAVLFVWGIKYLVRRVKEHRMSPIERAWVELDRLLGTGLPGRGRYKDFYVELTMVVRRYVQRKYGIRAPHLTTQEFFEELAVSSSAAKVGTDALKVFLESADMVKFAGVEATPEMADAAVEGARGYLKDDSHQVVTEEVKK